MLPPHLVTAGSSSLPSPQPWPSSSPCPRLLFLTPHLLVMADGYEELGQAARSRCVRGKDTPGWAAGGREIIQGFCHCWAAVRLPQLPLLLLGSLMGSVLESVSLWTGLPKTENRINTAARSDHSIFPHCASDRFTYTWHDSCLQLAEPHSQGEGGGRTKWDK